MTDEHNSSKILGIDLAEKKILKFKKAGKSVGMCHGGFDLLHAGHIKHFESAKKLCDILVVSVTSDKYVTLRKGKGRPIFSEKLRAYTVAAIEYVDYVVITDFQTATHVINKLKPSYYIKGPDYIGKETPGIISERNAIQKLGGKVKYTADEKLSSTAIIEKMQKREKILLIADRDGTLIDKVDFLGREKNWRQKVKIKKDVAGFVAYLQKRYDVTTLVVSNQGGVSRKYFGCERVDEINEYISELLEKDGIVIDNWKYCAYADTAFAKAHSDIEFDWSFVIDKTDRKPTTGMVSLGLKEIKTELSHYNCVLVIGDREEDSKLADNLKASYIDVKKIEFDELKKKFHSLMNL